MSAIVAESLVSLIAALPPVREAIRGVGLNAKKGLGQNFLLDMNLTRRIAESAKISGGALGVVIEIGPGPGGLTRALLTAGAEKVIAIEKDVRAINALAPLVQIAGDRLQLIEADALDFEISMPCQIIANLPYNIATALLIRWLDRLEHIDAMTLMFQKEVAERIVAPPDCREYGRLSVLCQWLCEVEVLFDIPREAFVPKPKVTSSVVRFVPRETPLATPLTVGEKPLLEEVTKVAFSQRRKMLRASLKGLGVEVAALLNHADIDGERRCAELSVAEFCRLAQSLKAIKEM